MACPRFNLSRRRDMFGSETCGCCIGATARLVLAARSQRSADAHDRSGGVYDVREGYFLSNQLPGHRFYRALRYEALVIREASNTSTLHSYSKRRRPWLHTSHHVRWLRLHALLVLRHGRPRRLRLRTRQQQRTWKSVPQLLRKLVERCFSHDPPPLPTT